MSDKQKIIVAVTGASGSIYAKRLFHYLSGANGPEVAVVHSSNAPTVWQQELQEEMEIPFPVYDKKDFFAPFASGSARFMHMVIVPCSMGTLARIANGISDDLITRAADVILKEKRQLICVTRETPLNLIHIQNMEKLTMAGAMIMPAAPSFYSNPASVDEVADTVVHRILDQLNINMDMYRWGS